MRVLAIVCALLTVAADAASGELHLTDADTVVWQGVKYRLDGIDAPESAQKCLRSDGTTWMCGKAATAALEFFISGKDFFCTDVGEDRKYHRRLGQCFADGTSIEHWLVKQGWAIEFKMHSNGRFAADEREAMQNHRGIWASCFTNPRDYCYSNKTSAQLKGDCPTASAEAAMVTHKLFWEGSVIKAKVFAWGRQLATGLKGIYHDEGCASYGKKASPGDGGKLVYFASASAAEGQGFRKAKNCM